MDIKEITIPLTAGKLVDGGKRFLGLWVDPIEDEDEPLLGRLELYDIEADKTICEFTDWFDVEEQTPDLAEWNVFSPRGISDKGAYFICYCGEEEAEGTVFLECFSKEDHRSEAKFDLSGQVKKFQKHYGILDAVKVTGDLYLLACAYKIDGGFEIFRCDRHTGEVVSLGLFRSMGFGQSFQSIWFTGTTGDYVVQWSMDPEEYPVMNCGHMRDRYRMNESFTAAEKIEEGIRVADFEFVKRKNESGVRFSNGLEVTARTERGMLRDRFFKEVIDGNSMMVLSSSEYKNEMVERWIANGGETLYSAALSTKMKDDHCTVKVFSYDRGLFQTLESTLEDIEAHFDEEVGALYCWNLMETTVFSVER